MDRIDRLTCRTWAAHRFSLELMAKRTRSSTSWPRSGARPPERQGQRLAHRYLAGELATEWAATSSTGWPALTHDERKLLAFLDAAPGG